ncbi:MAG TPA: hypothetical protein VN033_06975 [Vulgatibacter sp.]|nr:hypothetical protein [Vulgatibacter sp.]
MEWVAELPLSSGKPEEFSLDLSAEIPAHVWTSHDHWERLQLLARLSSPAEGPTGIARQLAGVDEVRRAALAAARRAKETQARLEKVIFSASSLLSAAASPTLGDDVLLPLRKAVDDLRAMRHELGEPRAGDSEDVARERALTQEFLSNHVIELLSRVESAIGKHLLGPRCRHAEYEADAKRIRATLAKELQEEIAWRTSRSLASPTKDDPWELERYVARVSVLRKHFQGLLFLRVKTQLSDARFRALFGAIAAGFGGLAVFPLALFLTGGHGVAGLSVGLMGVALLVALTYGLRERVKDGVRGWLTSRVSRNLGGRFTTMTTTPRLLSKGVELLSARESFFATREHRADPLHPDLGSTLPVVRLRYIMRGVLRPDRRLAGQGCERVKLVFRYDLSPLFARLDDPIKYVPILAEDGASLRFVEAARCYRVPVRLSLTHGGETATATGTLVTHKLGLERIEDSKGSAEPPAPPLMLNGTGAFASVASSIIRRR